MAIEAQALTLLDPRTQARATLAARAARPSALHGKRVGLLANGKPNSVEFLEALGRLLRERHGAAELFAACKPSSSRVAPDAVLAELAAHCDVVVTAVGD